MKTSRDFKGVAHYRCRCGIAVSMFIYRAYQEVVRMGFANEYCTISPSGKHSFDYVYPEGHTAVGPRRS